MSPIQSRAATLAVLALLAGGLALLAQRLSEPDRQTSATSAASPLAAARSTPSMAPPGASAAASSPTTGSGSSTSAAPPAAGGSASTAAPAHAPAHTAPEPSGPLNAEQFQELASKTFRELPTIAELGEITSEEAHGYPEPIARAGPLLGRIAQAVQDQPSLKPQAFDFYVRCAQDRDIVTPVRALCYSHILSDPKAPPTDSLPAEVVRLAKLIPAE